MNDFKKIITVLAIMIVILMTVFIHYARQYRDINTSFIHDWLIVFFWIALISLGATLMSYAMYKLTKKK